MIVAAPPCSPVGSRSTRASADNDAILSRMHPGSVIKVNAVYDEPFWREEGLSGQWLDPTAVLSFGLDNSPPDGSPGVLVGFFESATARELGRGAR